MTTTTITSEEYNSLMSEIDHLSKERDRLQKHVDLLELNALKKSADYEKMRKIADAAIAELKKVQKMVEATIL